MATILEFRSSGRTEAMPAMKSGRGGTWAEIVFFPGVRYERWDASASPKPQRRTKKRDKIEVND